MINIYLIILGNFFFNGTMTFSMELEPNIPKQTINQVPLLKVLAARKCVSTPKRKIENLKADIQELIKIYKQPASLEEAIAFYRIADLNQDHDRAQELLEIALINSNPSRNIKHLLFALDDKEIQHWAYVDNTNREIQLQDALEKHHIDINLEAFNKISNNALNQRIENYSHRDARCCCIKLFCFVGGVVSLSVILWATNCSDTCLW